MKRSDACIIALGIEAERPERSGVKRSTVRTEAQVRIKQLKRCFERNYQHVLIVDLKFNLKKGDPQGRLFFFQVAKQCAGPNIGKSCQAGPCQLIKRSDCAGELHLQFIEIKKAA